MKELTSFLKIIYRKKKNEKLTKTFFRNIFQSIKGERKGQPFYLLRDNSKREYMIKIIIWRIKNRRPINILFLFNVDYSYKKINKLIHVLH